MGNSDNNPMISSLNDRVELAKCYDRGILCSECEWSCWGPRESPMGFVTLHPMGRASLGLSESKPLSQQISRLFLAALNLGCG